MTPRPPMLIAIGGLSGSGKSTLADQLAQRLALPVLSSDRLRKERLGLALVEPAPPEVYRLEAIRAVYDAMLAAAADQAALGGSIVDAVFARPDERTQIEAVARMAGIRFVGFWLSAPVETRRNRVAARPPGASDATTAIVDRQEEYELGEIDWIVLDNIGDPTDLAETAYRALPGIQGGT